MLEFNIELAEKVLAQITAYPETHNQGIWSNHCGTVRCVAGWTVALAKSEGESDSDFMSRYAETYGTLEDGYPQVAADLLGLNEYDADNLFYTLGDNESAVEMLRLHIEQARDDVS